MGRLLELKKKKGLNKFLLSVPDEPTRMGSSTEEQHSVASQSWTELRGSSPRNRFKVCSYIHQG